MVIDCGLRRARMEAAAIGYASPWSIPVVRLFGREAVNTTLNRQNRIE